MKKKKIVLFIVLISTIVFASFAIQGKRRFFVRIFGTSLGWEARLYTPTQIDRCENVYFLVDCWHNRIIFSTTLDEHLRDWQILDDNLAGPHSIATDGGLFLTEDTGRNCLCVYRRTENGFKIIQRISSVGLRPHRVRFDPATSAFFALSSNSQEISKLWKTSDSLRLDYTRHLRFLENSYTRSFSFINGHMFFVSGPGRITETEYRDDSYRVLHTYEVPPGFREMNDLERIGQYFYLTATPRAVLRTKSLEGLQSGMYEDLYQRLGLKGTPYYLSVFDGRVYLPQIEEYSGVVSFELHGDSIADVRTVYDSGAATWIDQQVQDLLPK